MKLSFWVKQFLLGFFLSVIISLGQYSYAQIDSRNQERPDKKEATSPKKRKKVKKSKKVRKQAKGKKTYSNKKQIKKSKKSFTKGGDKGHKGTITGRKVKKTKTTPRQTYARPQPDPYAGRRIRTEKQRAGPPPKKIKTATKKGEVARSGDISGRKRIRQRSVSTNPKPIHPQPNTYRGVKRRTEKDRAYSNKKQVQSIRSVSRQSETRKKKTTTRVVTATAPHIAKRKKNVYRNHEQRKGEQASTKDIAGRKLRTKNYKSEKPSKGGRTMANPVIRSEKKKSGERFRKYKIQSGGAKSISQSSESKGGGEQLKSQRNMKNFSSTKTKSVVQPKPPRSFGNRKKGSGEAAIFAAYRPKKIRSVTKKSESKPGKRKPSAPSISGARVFSNKKIHPYRGKDRRFSGEHSTSKDITGRTLRTKNFKSRHPNYSSIGSMNYRSASKSPSNKNYNKNKAKSISGGSFNNNGQATSKRNADLALGFFSGNRKSIKRLQGGGSVSKRWNNNGSPLIKKVGSNPNIGSFAGNVKYKQPAKGGGSVSKRWNNNGDPLLKLQRSEQTIAATKFQGNVKVTSEKQSQSSGTKYGEAKKIAGIKIGTGAGTMHKQKRLKLNNNLPKQLDRSQKRRAEADLGTKRGTDWAFSFWEFGNPIQMGLVKQHTKAKGKLHPSTNFNYNSTNSIDEKQKTVSVKLMWSKLINKNAATPEPEKEYSHKLKYSKEERSIWETKEREDWYKK